MLHSILTPVKIIEAQTLDGSTLSTIIRYTTGIGDHQLQIAVIRDDYPMPYRNRIIQELHEDMFVTEFSKVSPNPRCEDIDSIMDEFNLTKYDAIVGIGGGSVLDSAKAVAMLATNGGKLDEYLGANPPRKIEKQGIALILIPTTAGTGSEVTKVGVYTATSGRKYTLGSPLLFARVAVLCGELTSSMPPKLTAAVGFDALDHALESIWNKNATSITRSIATDAAVEVLSVLDAAYDASLRMDNSLPMDAEVRQRMLSASCKAGVAFNMTGTAAGHALSFVLSEEWHIPHGAACAFTLVEIFTLAMQDSINVRTLAEIAKKFFPDEQDNITLCNLLLNKIIAMKSRMQMSEKFSDLGISITIADIPGYFDRAFSDPKMLNQLPSATSENIYPLLQAKL